MNQSLLKLRYYRCFIGKVYYNIFRPNVKEYIYGICGARNVKAFNFNCMPLICTYNQVRDYAKKSQGKAPKGKRNYLSY